MPPLETDATKLKEMLANEFQQVKDLLELLVRERTVLESGSSQELDEITAAKNPVVETLEQALHQRALFFEERGLANNKQSIEKIFSKEKDSSRWLKLLNKNIDLMQECKDANLVNACIMNSCYHQSQRLIQTLLGPKVAHTYTKQGNNHTSRSNNGTLGEA